MDINEIINGLIGQINANNSTYNTRIDYRPGTVIYNAILYPFSYIIKLSLDLFDSIYNRLNISTATETDLEAIAANYGITRNTGTMASGIVRFYYNNNPGSVVVNGGLVNAFYNNTTVSYKILMNQTVNSFNLNNDQKSKYYNKYYFEAPIVCTTVGIIGNVPAGAIRYRGNVFNLSVFPDYIDNENAISNGTDIETDDMFRQRIKLYYSGSSGTKNGYKITVLNNFSVRDVNVISGSDLESQRKYSPNTVDVIILPNDSDIITETYSVAPLSGPNNSVSYIPKLPVIDVVEVVGNGAYFSKSDTIYKNSILENSVLNYNSSNGVTFKYLYSDIIRIIQNFFDSDENKIIGSDLMVKVAEPKKIDITVKFKKIIGYDSTTIDGDLYDAVINYISSLKIGAKVQTSDIVDICYNVAGIDYVNVELKWASSTQTVSELSCGPYEYLYLPTVNMHREELQS